MGIELDISRNQPAMPPGGYTIATATIGSRTFTDLHRAIENGWPIPTEGISAAFVGTQADTHQLDAWKNLRDVALDGAAYWMGSRPEEIVRGYTDLAVVLHRMIVDQQPTPAMYFFHSRL